MAVHTALGLTASKDPSVLPSGYTTDVAGETCPPGLGSSLGGLGADGAAIETSQDKKRQESAPFWTAKTNSLITQRLSLADFPVCEHETPTQNSNERSFGAGLPLTHKQSRRLRPFSRNRPQRQSHTEKPSCLPRLHCGAGLPHAGPGQQGSGPLASPVPAASAQGPGLEGDRG